MRIVKAPRNGNHGALARYAYKEELYQVTPDSLCPDCTTPAILVEYDPDAWGELWSQPVHDASCPSLHAEEGAAISDQELVNI